MTTRRSATDIGFITLLVVTAVSCVWTIQVIFFRAPIEATMGIAQKIFYFHVPLLRQAGRDHRPHPDLSDRWHYP
jgi:hypothetical protein